MSKKKEIKDYKKPSPEAYEKLLSLRGTGWGWYYDDLENTIKEKQTNTSENELIIGVSIKNERQNTIETIPNEQSVIINLYVNAWEFEKMEGSENILKYYVAIYNNNKELQIQTPPNLKLSRADDTIQINNNQNELIAIFNLKTNILEIQRLRD